MTDRWLGPRALAAVTGVSTDTLRHYERLQLLTGVERTRSGYRRYSPAAVDRVRLIRRALVVGFSLQELASALKQRDQGAPPCGRMRALIGERLTALDARLIELAAIRDEMRVVIRDWDLRLAQTPPGQRARLLDMLDGRVTLEREAARAMHTTAPKKRSK